MKPLLLIRHSSPEVDGAIPAWEWRLSMAGKVRARQLAQLVAPYRPHLVVSSLEPKALETAQILADQLNITMQTAVGLHEHDRHGVPFYSPEEFQQTMRQFFDYPERLVFGNETASQAVARFHSALQTVLHTFEERPVAVVTHGTVISLFVSELTGCDGFELWSKLSLPACVVLDVESRRLLELINLK